MRQVLLVLAVTFAAGAASAQTEGGGGPSPEIRAAFQAARQACMSDAKTYCSGSTGREMMMCLRENTDKVSAACKDALGKLPARHRQPH